MAKQGQKQEANRQTLLGELTGLRAANLRQDGDPRADAVPQELVRIEEIEKLLSIAPNAGMKIGPPAAPADPEPPADETATQKIKRLERENAELRAKESRSRGAAKMKSAEKKVGHVERPDEIMNKGMAIAEDTDPANWGDNIKLAVERTIRRYVRKGGSRKNQKGDWYDIPAGFKKGIPFEEKVYALKLLAQLGRLKEPVEKIIKLIEGRGKLTVSKKRQTAKEFNFTLEELGVGWDDSIQVPGMSATLRS